MAPDHDAIGQAGALGFRNDRGAKFSLERREVEFCSGGIVGEQETNEAVTKTAMAVIEHRDDWNGHGNPEGLSFAEDQRP
jgi:hypothetical protein